MESSMIGFIRIADIPKMLVGFVVGVILFGAFLLILREFPSLMRHTPEWVLIGAVLLVLWASFELGDYIWERVSARF
jgi:hypothetical protein